jgi:uncharacterized protein YndB with AHSA1/START domain
MNDVQSTETTLHMTRMIPAPIQKVWDAWTQPELLARWAAPEGIDHIEYDVDLKPGGAYTLRMKTPEGGQHTAVGVYTVVDAPHRLAYTWDWVEEDYHMGVETLVTVEFRPAGEATEVVLTHERFPVEDATQGHIEGWSSCLNRLQGIFS